MSGHRWRAVGASGRSLAVLAVLTLAAACSVSDGGSEPRTLPVPAQFATIQDAVDAARPGDLVLISPGRYRESVLVVTPDVTIRGTDRNAVVLDGVDGLPTGIRVLDTGGVAVENLTVRNYAGNGLSWTDAAGFRASHVTVHDNGKRGVEIFDSVNGLIEEVWASGSTEAGIHISQCDPCRIVVDQVTSLENGTGLLLVNAGRELQVVRSTFKSNRSGIDLHSTSFSLCAPQQGATIAGNLVGPNGRSDLTIGDVGIVSDSSGIAVVGGRDNLIVRNRVVDNQRFGIVVAPYPELDANAPVPDATEVSEPCRTRAFIPSSGRIAVNLWPSTGNRIVDNVVVRSGRTDIAVGGVADETARSGNCASGNEAAVTQPTDLQTIAPCDGSPAAAGWDRNAYVVPDLDRRQRRKLLEVDDDVEMVRGPIPPPQAQLPDPAGSPAVPAAEPPEPVDLAAIRVPG